MLQTLAAIEASDLTLVRGYGGTTAEALTDNQVLHIIGNAALEGADRPAARFTNRASLRWIASAEMSGQRWEASGYAQYYDWEMLSDPTYDFQINQFDRRWTAGGRFERSVIEEASIELDVGGELRYDDIGKVGLDHTENGVFVENISHNRVTETSLGVYAEATWLPTEPGRWTATTAESALGGLGLTGEVVVSLPDDELRRPETDHDLLARLSEETGGRVFDPGDLDDLPQELPNRRVRLVSETAEPLWDTPLALLLTMGLLTVEWVGRRLVRLI